MVLIGPRSDGRGMEEIYQVTSALKYLDVGRSVALLTDARFSGVSTGPCIGHVGPEALAGGPDRPLRDGDRIRVVIDRRGWTARSISSRDARRRTPADEALRARERPDLAPDPALPDDTRLWAALQQASGGTWGGCVYDADAILEVLERGLTASGDSLERLVGLDRELLVVRVRRHRIHFERAEQQRTSGAGKRRARGQPHLAVHLRPLEDRPCAFVDASDDPPAERHVVDRLCVEANELILGLADPGGRLEFLQELAGVGPRLEIGLGNQRRDHGLVPMQTFRGRSS